MGTEQASGGAKAWKCLKIPAEAHPLPGEPTAIASTISYHAKFVPIISPLTCEPEQVFYATAESVWDRLIRKQAAAVPLALQS